ncbi:MAG: hypothetical protein IJV14_07775 [Lachnospiraceae bacterium]|nr:hypothetical protein [Lachnospiraceae bacterium]
MGKYIKIFTLFLTGALIYVLIELAWRGHSHWTMFLIGGMMFVLIGSINEYIPWEMPLWLQGIIGSGIVTITELLSGYIINIKLGWHVWDYSNMPLNLAGQICLPFSLLWILMSIVAIGVDDWLRYWLFGEERPHYKLI